MSLNEYARKRDFRKTAEPAPKKVTGDGSVHRFVVQKHDASHLHYDFRLEMDGTLKSWAVPKGIPHVKGEKRLAIHVEDHPVSYIDFEGTIPKGQYGGGTVMVWDYGTYEPAGDSPLKDLEGGKLHFKLAGEKLKGEWYLVRLKDPKQWLLVRAGADMKPISKKADDLSAKSGRTMKEISQHGEVYGQQTRKPSVRRTIRAKTSTHSHPMPDFIPPMKARPLEAPPTGDWVYEIKFDGFRALAFKEGKQVRLLSRNNKDLGAKFPEIVEAVSRLKAREIVLDGEIVAVDDKGRSSFQLLQAYELGELRPPLFYYVFDLLHLDGVDQTRRVLADRKESLKHELAHAPPIIRYSSSVGEDAEVLLKQAKALGLEGLIGKRKDSLYESDRRSGAWIKLKIQNEQEFIIGGYTPPGGARQHFGALLLGYYKSQELIYAGKVGTGFNHSLLTKLYSQFQKIAQEECPFVNLPESPGDRHSARITSGVMKRCHWLKPQLMCQIRFAEWTRDSRLRAPVFLGIRDDKSPRQVRREEVLAS